MLPPDVEVLGSSRVPRGVADDSARRAGGGKSAARLRPVAGWPSLSGMAEADRDKWDARYAKERPGERTAPAWLAAFDAELPRAGRALDVGAGSGRLALWAARRGLRAVAVDVSPRGLSLASAAAAAEGLELTTVERDLAEEPRLPEGPFSLITCVHYEQPALWPAMRAALGPGGVLVAEIATVRNLERHAHPSRRYLVEPNALLSRLEGLELVYYRQGWLGHGERARNVARVVARRA